MQEKEEKQEGEKEEPVEEQGAVVHSRRASTSLWVSPSLDLLHAVTNRSTWLFHLFEHKSHLLLIFSNVINNSKKKKKVGGEGMGKKTTQVWLTLSFESQDLCSSGAADLEIHYRFVSSLKGLTYFQHGSVA